MKSKSMILGVIIVLIVLLCGIGIGYYLNNVKNYFSIFEGNYYYVNDEENSTITFYKWNKNVERYKIINEYNYNDDFYVSAENLENGRIVFEDYSSDNFVKLFDFEKGIIDEFDIYLMGLSNYNNYYSDNFEYYVVIKNGKFGMLNKKLEYVIEPIYDELGKYFGDPSPTIANNYDLKNDIIRFKSNSKYGILKLSDGSMVLEAQFEDLEIFEKGFYKSKEKGLWKLYNLEEYQHGMYNSYQNIFYVNNDVWLVQNNGKLYIKNSWGYNMTEDTIPVYMNYNYSWACPGCCEGIYYYDGYNTLTIVVDKEDSEKCFATTCEECDDGTGYEKYEYNYDTHKITKINN